MSAPSGGVLLLVLRTLSTFDCASLNRCAVGGERMKGVGDVIMGWNWSASRLASWICAGLYGRMLINRFEAMTAVF